jgi:peptide/nickel transport system permease protein
MQAGRLSSALKSLRSRYNRKYFAVRVADLVIVFFAILIINFILPRLMPGNFAIIFARQLTLEHHGLSYPTVLHTIEKQFGLGTPITTQFFRYLQDVVSLAPSFGASFQYYPADAWTVVFIALKWTLLLLGVSQAIAWSSGLFIGVFLALRKNSAVDRVLQPVFYFLNSIPGYWLGMMFIFLFAIELRVLPASQAYDITPTVLGILNHMVLPVTVLVIITLPSHVLVTRATAIEVLDSDFVLLSKAQGLGRRRILLRVLRNSMLPSLTRIFLTIGYLIGGVITVEYTFSYPGMGTVIGNAVLTLDYPVLQAALYLTSLVILLSNLAADLLYPLVDPRVSYAASEQGGRLL